MKSEVCRCRLSREIKAELERAAQRRGVSTSRILELAVREWLRKNPSRTGESKTQAELHAAAQKYFGVLRGVGPGTAQTVRETARKRVRQRILNSQRKADSSLRSE